ncbi:transglutaminase family protein [Minwuia sp.]|uniref:transglutaminase family protein n=1 Tax=Minwuia sp. TaxID=2493630 RepID=UPI003A8E0B25
MIYRVRHRTAYRYADTVMLSHHLLHVTPRATPAQVRMETRLEISPAPAEQPLRQTDYYGNEIAVFNLATPHDRFVVESTSLISVNPPATPDPTDTPAWTEVAKSIQENLEPSNYAVADFVGRHEFSDIIEQLRDYAAPSLLPDRPLLDAAMDLNQRIYKDFVYDPKATDVTTSVATVLQKRRGVCQDFAHLMIACLRSFGLPARYVSGYLRTLPPPGKPRLIGADQSHAWVSIFIPEAGWIDLDPTNACLAGGDHITLGWGRTYADVAPVRGVITGGGEHQLKVEVDVAPQDSDPAPPDELVA